MSIYVRQKRYFEEAYRSGKHGWPVSEPAPFVVEFMQSVRRKNSVDRVLDIGCGEGRHTILFAQSGYTTVGIDLQPLAIQRALQFTRARKIRKDPGFLVGSVFSLPFRENAFDVLIDYGCLHHIRKPDFPRYLNSTVPLLKPAGYFLLSCFSTRFKHEPGERRTRDWLVHRGHYDRFFRKTDFQRLFGRHYEILKMREVHDRVHPHYVFHHVLMKKKA